MPRRGFGAGLRSLLLLAANDRAALRDRLQRAIGIVRARWVFRNCERGAMVNATGPVRVEARGRIRLGDRVQFWGGMIPHELICAPGAELVIGACSMFNYGISLRAERSIRIGERCMFGSFVHVHDEDRERTAPIVIEDDVWIAHGAVIGPGVTVGEGSVVSAGSVVTEDVPRWSLAIGNPARCTPLATDRRRTRQR